MGLKELPDDEFDMEQIGGASTKIHRKTIIMFRLFTTIWTGTPLRFFTMFPVLNGSYYEWDFPLKYCRPQIMQICDSSE